MQPKEFYIHTTFSEIRAKKLKEPIQLNAGVVIPDLERYLETMRKALLSTENKKMLKHFVSELEILSNFNQLK